MQAGFVLRVVSVAGALAVLAAGAGTAFAAETTAAQPEPHLPPPVVHAFESRTVIDVSVPAAGADAMPGHPRDTGMPGSTFRIFLHGGKVYSGYWVPGGTIQPRHMGLAVEFKDGQYAGAFTLKQGKRGSIQGTLRFRLPVKPSAPGTGKVEVGGNAVDATVALVDLEQLKRSNALADGAAYRQMSGVDTAGPMPTRHAIVEDINQARLAWKSEDSTALSATPKRYGWGGPVVADGLVIHNYYQPTGEPPFFDVGNRALDINAWKADPQLKPYTSRIAHDVVVAADAATGLTRWRTVLPNRALNQQGDQKNNALDGGISCVAGDVVVVPGYGGRLYGLELQSGKVLWERVVPEQSEDLNAIRVRQVLAEKAGIANLGAAGTLLNSEPVYCGGVVALDVKGILAIEPKTGATLWHDPAGAGADWRNHVRIHRDGQAGHFVYPRNADRRREYIMVEPRSGKVVATIRPDVKMPVNAKGDTGRIGWCLAGGKLIVFSAHQTSFDAPMHVFGFDLKDGVTKPAWSLVLDEVRFHASFPVMAHGHLYLGGVREQKIARIDPANGKLIGYCPPITGQNGYFNLTAAWDRIFLNESSHISMVIGDPAVQKPVTTLSGFPVNYGYDRVMPRIALVDGRMFVQVDSGLACLDLRKKE